MIGETTSQPKVRKVAATATITDINNNSNYITFTEKNNIKSFEITRVGDESKFFGFGITHRLNLKLVNITDDTLIKVHNKIVIVPSIMSFDKNTSATYEVYPPFYITEVHINTKTHEYSITAYDVLHDTEKHYSHEIEINAPYTVGDITDAAAAVLGVSASHTEGLFNTLNYPEGANLEGTETLREVLDAIAEVTQTIYYINFNGVLIFKRLDYSGDAALTITKNDYFELSSKTNRRLQTVASVTELGDNYSASTTQAGTTQYVRNNPFWELRDDIADLVDAALEVVGNTTIAQIEVKWRGNLGLEAGDKIDIVTLENEVLTSYVLDDTISYDGTLNQKTQWNYEDSDETEANPTNLGEALKQTYAKVDKVNKEISIVASQSQASSAEVAAMKINTDSISTSVSAIQDSLQQTSDSLNEQLGELEKKVQATITSEDVQLEVQSALANGVSEVKTSTGFTFNDKGLTINKSDSEVSTNINEDGMTITRNSTKVLTADNKGVTAYNLHANTYLIIGINSRFEDYENNTRTGCFWIGG